MELECQARKKRRAQGDDLRIFLGDLLAALPQIDFPGVNRLIDSKLKIADAFRYDQDQGQYTARSDLILHGWCEPKCAETPSTPCGNPK